ncbi:MAG TPA: hypothetical protein VMJ92_01775 [Candidatus Limnocylindrales bacterium]|nr:hypothetical protein [Candidatus Limnocylindrales bacterium]
MDEYLRIGVQYLHVMSGILWIGGGFYTLFVQLPAVLAAPAAARGPVMAQLAPRQIFYILRVAELTLFTGLAQVFTTGRARELENVLGSRWAAAIAFGTVLAIVLYLLVRMVVKPTVERMLVLGPKAAAGDAAAPAEIARLIDRVRRVGQVQVGLGLVIVFAMVLARFS